MGLSLLLFTCLLDYKDLNLGRLSLLYQRIAPPLEEMANMQWIGMACQCAARLFLCCLNGQPFENCHGFSHLIGPTCYFGNEVWLKHMSHEVVRDHQRLG